MDFFTEPMENQRETIIHEKNVTAFGLSLQGASHLERNPLFPVRTPTVCAGWTPKVF